MIEGFKLETSAIAGVALVSVKLSNPVLGVYLVSPL